MRLFLFFLFFVIIAVVEAQNNPLNQTQARKWRLVPAARGARNLQASESKALGVMPKLITLEGSRLARHSEKHAQFLNDGEFEDITRSEQPRRKVRKIARKGRRVEEGVNEKTTTENPLRPTTAVHRLQSKRKHFVIVAPTPPESTPSPIIAQLSNGTNNQSSTPTKEEKSVNSEEVEGKARRKTSFEVEIGPDFKREIQQEDQSGIKVETGPSGTPTLEISPENLPEEYRKLLAKGYHSYPTFNSKNYKRPPQALFEANLVPSMNIPPIQPQFPMSNQIPIPFQPTQPNSGIQIFPGAQGNSFVIPQGVGNQNVNLNLLMRARQLLALRELELIKAKQDLLLQQAKQSQLQHLTNRAGRAIGESTQSIDRSNAQIDPFIMAELHRRQLFTAQLMQQAQQRAYYPDATFMQSGAIPQNLAPPPQIGSQFGAPFLAPITDAQQQSAGNSPFQTPSATFLQNGQQIQIPVVFKRALPK
ncbi:unnamed protein product, partial [Mesorhabditis belari]|uniref:Uncharacterized protein n=1 Tax=Mesorhabditis belari TaxID=2138241 RepID=A0AAF3EMG9_9BILA